MYFLFRNVFIEFSVFLNIVMFDPHFIVYEYQYIKGPLTVLVQIGTGHGVGEVPLKTFPISIMFNDEIWLFPPKIEVFVLRNQKANL